MTRRSTARGELPEAALRLNRWMGPRVLTWFHDHCRDLPWRHNRDPYRIWVSEVMLQQTQVATVIPFFQRFLERFPTLADLAQADEQEVLRLWEGLGYYRRARFLLQAARLLHERNPGVFPATVAELTGVPGLGEYTRNAILSQAFDLRLPILEANTIRLLSRMFGRVEDPTQTSARRWLWGAAEAILPSRQVGDFNQGLMELGALVCTPEQPDCSSCPLRPRCAAFASGRPEDYPARVPASPPVLVRELALIIRRAGTVLFLRRPPDATRWANLWEFPHVELAADEPLDQAAHRLARESCGLTITPGAELGTIRHGITRYSITLTCLEACWSAGDVVNPFHAEARWVGPDELGQFPVSSPQRRLARLINAERQLRLF
ncbi:MAG: A/G-specific adenine glycosylase [Gemmataceae bacterium]